MHCAPLSDLNDGHNDIILQSEDKSRSQLYKLMNGLNDGEIFNKDFGNGKINPEYGAEYIKCKEWYLKPNLKGPVPEEMKYNLPENTIIRNNAVFAIDGERYPAQDVSAKVLPKALNIYY